MKWCAATVVQTVGLTSCEEKKSATKSGIATESSFSGYQAMWASSVKYSGLTCKERSRYAVAWAPSPTLKRKTKQTQLSSTVWWPTTREELMERSDPGYTTVLPTSVPHPIRVVRFKILTRHSYHQTHLHQQGSAPDDEFLHCSDSRQDANHLKICFVLVLSEIISLYAKSNG